MPDILKKLAELIGYLPGIGDKTAMKLAFFLLKTHPSYLEKLSQSIQDLQKNIHECRECFALTDKTRDICLICQNPERNTQTLCVVEDYLDMIAIERLWIHKGRYHILGGLISPMNAKMPKDLTLDALFERISKEWIKELILALNANIEWEATSLYIEEQNTHKSLHISRLSKWLPNAGFIEYADDITLINAFRGRG